MGGFSRPEPTLTSLLFRKQPEYFSEPKDNGCTTDDVCPILYFKRDNIKHLSTDGDNQDLSNYDGERNSQETGTALEMECRTTCHEGTGVKHIPELQHDEYREEHAQFVRSQLIVSLKPCEIQKICDTLNLVMLENVKQAEQGEEEDTTDT